MAIYVIGHQSDTGPVKIGTSITPASRLLSIRRGDSCPASVRERFVRDIVQLEILDRFDGERPLERALHRDLREHRIGGEWFTLGPNPDAVRYAVSCALDRINGVVPCAIEGCTRVQWLRQKMCKAHDLEAWLRPAA